MVVAQCATIAAVIIGTVTPACITNDQCGSGMYCSIGENRCQFWCATFLLRIVMSSTSSAAKHTLDSHERGCSGRSGSNSPAVIQYGPDGETYNQPFDRRFVGHNKTYIMELCHDPVWVPTCAHMCYMSDPGLIVFDGSGLGGNRITCRETCDAMDMRLTAEGVWNDDGRNMPPGAGRMGYNSVGKWCVWPTVESYIAGP